MTSQSATPEDRNAPTETEEWILRCAQSGTLKRYENGSWSGDSQWMDSSEEVTAEALLTEGRIAFAGEAIEGWLYRWVRPAIPGASGTPMDLIGKIVRWEDPEFQPGMWFTALVTDGSAMGGSYTGTVVDPGNYKGRMWPFEPFEVGDHVPNLVASLCTVIDSEPYTDDPECE